MVDGQWRDRLPSDASGFPADLAMVLVLLALSDAFVFLPFLRETAIRPVVAFPLLLFLPGYAVLAALYPERGDVPSGADDGARGGATGAVDADVSAWDHHIWWLERVVLSVGLSVALVALIGLSLNLTPVGLRLVPLLVSVNVLAVVATVAAWSRRADLPGPRRFSVPFRSYAADVRNALTDPGSRTDAVLNVLLVVAILVASSSVGYALVSPDRGETFSEFYLLSPDESGELRADDFPTTLTRGEPTELVVGVGNHEREPVEYTVVGELQRVRRAGNETVVTSETRITWITVELQPGETALLDQTVEPSVTGQRLRLVYLLYRTDPPPDPSTDTAYRSTYLWVNVTETPSSEG